ncbi:potassium transporter Kup [Geminisphaera colitermitum]|uniref:potassium transporter Kup n=1 Tax=Geminisphaera colitermitum TaxID=1148786 RepID=UPI000158C8C1|nr:KUP/HAK/KT family potassium transporter [Geminisphaera colitermitum]
MNSDSDSSADSNHANSGAGRNALKLGLCLGALGVVFGDIGTSPLYTMKECMATLPQADRAQGVYGVLSLIFWALMLVVCVKYLWFVMRADNRGEGGIFALLALSQVRHIDAAKGRAIGPSLLVILFGAALLYGDSVITPAITVLSAVEGLKGVSSVFAGPDAEHYIVFITAAILAVLFWFQKKGSQLIGSIFGPVMLVWFAVIGLLGLWHLRDAPQILAALNPAHGVALLISHPGGATMLLGSVVLAVTGAEALYADMGHFGRPAISRAWFYVALPGLVLNYFGQGAYILKHHGTAVNPFFELVPEGLPRAIMTILSACAAIIASQAVISGAYSLTRSAIQLGYFPRLKVTHTNAEQAGQIYIPLINTTLAILSIGVVFLFGSSDRLAAAYGIAVTGTMVVTTYAFLRVAHRRWRWPLWKTLGLCSVFFAIDIALFYSTLHKFLDGGWLPLGIAFAVIAIMHTWKIGRNAIHDIVYGSATMDLELSDVAKSKSIIRVPGSAVFMVGTPKGTPLALLHHLKANKCLQQTAVLLTILTEDVPQVNDEERMTLELLGEGVWRATGRYGYMESPDVAKLCERIAFQGVPLNLQATTFYFNREMIISGGNTRMFEWQKSLYAFLSRNARPVKDYYRILPTQIIEIGLPVQL